MATETTKKEAVAVEEATGKIGRVGITERAHRLKRRIISKAPTYLSFGPHVGGCMERARLWTQSYMETEGDPECIRRAKALAKVLDNMTIFIKDEELLVSYTASRPQLMPLHPEIGYTPMEKILNEPVLTDEAKAELREIVKYWKPRCLQSRTESMWKEDEIQRAGSNAAFNSTTYRDGQSTAGPDYTFQFTHGFNQIIKIIEEKQLACEDRIHNGFCHPEIKDYIKRWQEYKAMVIACKAAIRWAQRYSELAAEMAKRETRPERKAELEEISRVCAKIPANPVEHFREGLQAVTFIHMIHAALERITQGSSMRIDYILWPYYRKDVIEDKILTKDQAQELFELFRIKFAELGRLGDHVMRELLQGTGDLQVMTIGGVNADGSDACTELTDVILDATRSIRTNQPSLALKYHSRISRRTLLKALDCIRAGLSLPSFHNNEHFTQQLIHFGATLEEARNSGMALCMSPTCMGRKGTRVRQPFSLQPAKCLELAFYDGYDHWWSKMQQGVHTGDATQFKKFEELWTAFQMQLRYVMQFGSRVRLTTRIAEAEYFQQPFLSSMFEGCIERGVDGIAWDEIPNPWINVNGLVDCGDALAAAKKLVFEDKKYTMKEMITALRANWEGYEQMREDFVNAPKFGNDIDYVDLVTRDVLNLINEECKLIKDYSGGTPMPLPQNVSGFWARGRRLAALPSGRRNGEVIADGGCSPYIGYDKKGPTAVLMSASKLDHGICKGNLLNQRLTPACIRGDKGAKLWLNYVKTAFDLNLNQIQFNVVDSRVLKEAQKTPDKYPDLVVRVSGYSAYFTELDKGVQDAIIARTEQALSE